MRERIYPAQWYRVREAEILTGMSNRAIRRRCQGLKKDGLLLKETSEKHLMLRGSVVKALRAGRDPNRAQFCQKFEYAKVHVKLDADPATDLSTLARHVLNGMRCLAELPTGDLVPVRLLVT